MFFRALSTIGGDLGAGIAVVFLGGVFMIITPTVGGICFVAVSSGMRIGFRQNKRDKYVPYIAALLIILFLSLKFITVGLTHDNIQKSYIERNTVDTVALTEARIKNNENMFKHWVVRSDSVREYQYMLYHKKGFVAEYIKEVAPNGQSLLLRRRIFDKNKKLITEDTTKVAKGLPTEAVPMSGITSFMVVNYVLQYNRQEITYEQLVKWCNYTLLTGTVDKKDAWNVVLVLTRIGISDTPQFPLSEDGFNELVGKLAVVARHPQ